MNIESKLYKIGFSFSWKNVNELEITLWKIQVEKSNYKKLIECRQGLLTIQKWTDVFSIIQYDHIQILRKLTFRVFSFSDSK